MAGTRQGSWARGELYELLCLMMIGYCLWFVGTRFGVFDHVLLFALNHDLSDLVMLSGCMGLGVFVAAIRKSFLLRKAIRQRAEARNRGPNPSPVTMR